MTTKPAKPRLGRGLSSLISNSAAVVELPVPIVPANSSLTASGQGTRTEISVDDIAPNPFQPRREFRDEELAQLADSIAQQGIIQPLVVAAAGELQSDKPYVLIAGERRLRAARRAGLASVPCVVREATRQQMVEWALIENIQRSDLNPMEKACAYRDYIDRFNLTQVDAAAKLGQPRATVANYLRLLELHQDIQRMLLEELLSFGHAKVLAGLVGQDQRQIELANMVVSAGLSVRQLEALVSNAQQPVEQAQESAPKESRTKSPNIRDLEEQLTSVLGTKVAILPGRAKHSGRLVINFYTLDDFDRITSSLGLKVES